MKKIFYVKPLATIVVAACLSTMQLWAANHSVSASYRTDKPEQKAQAIVADQQLDRLRRSSPQDYIRRVCSEISSHTSNGFLRAKLAHDVTALLLFYDDINYWNRSVPQQTLSHVLKTRKAVCEGYANLFKALCDGIGLPCEKIHGYARGVGANERGYEDPTDSNHAWNMVKIQGEWYLLDCTWDSGYMNGRTSVQDYRTTWLFVQPEQMIYSHYPSQQSHQLLEYPLSPQEFTRLPDLRPNLFDSATLQELPERTNQVEAVSVLNYQVQPGTRLSFSVRDVATESSIPNTVFYETDPQTGVTTTFLVPPRPGTYKVQIFVWKKEGEGGKGCGHFFITTTASRPSHINLSTSEGRLSLLGSGEYSSFSKKNSPQAIARARTSTPREYEGFSSPSPARRQSHDSDFLDYQEESAMAGIFVGGGDLLKAREMDRQHNLSFGFLLPSFWLGDWGKIFYWGGKVEVEGNIAGSHTLGYSLLAGATMRLGRLQPYIEGGLGVSHGDWKPTFEATPGIDLSLGKQSPIALGVFYKFKWHADWERITGRSEYLGARLLIRPMNFRSLDWSDTPGSDGNHVISLGYTFPTDLAKAGDFSAGSKDNFGISVSWESADNKLYPTIFALSYRRSQVQEEGGSHQPATTGYGTKQEPVRETRPLTHHTLMLEASLGLQVIHGLVVYGGGGIGLSLIPENKKEGAGQLAENVPWQVQGGVRVKLFDLLYTRTQVAYLHTGEFLSSVHLGLAL